MYSPTNATTTTIATIASTEANGINVKLSGNAEKDVERAD